MNGRVVAVVATAPGWRVEAVAPRDTDPGRIPPPSDVVAWAQVDDPETPGGCRVEPVFLADGRTWTPDQYRDAYGRGIVVCVGRAR